MSFSNLLIAGALEALQQYYNWTLCIRMMYFHIPSSSACGALWSALPFLPSWWPTSPAPTSSLPSPRDVGSYRSPPPTPDARWEQHQLNQQVTAHKLKGVFNETQLSYKLICPSSSCRARSRSDSRPGDPSAGVRSLAEAFGAAEANSLQRFFLTPPVDLCRALTCWQSQGWWCFIMWSMPWTLAWTEWLGLVDYQGEGSVNQRQQAWKTNNLESFFYLSGNKGHFLGLWPIWWRPLTAQRGFLR